jgi:aspartyl-tRNA(Asn)/glutamyl-tRNA(Gln) amidotransferase subunit A
MDGIWLARPESPRPGKPVAIKDLLDTEGLVTTYGSSIFADHVPTRTATSVLRLEAAGYSIAGKTNLHEFAYGITSQNAHFGTVPNPRHPGRVAGGSSGGSAAAVAAGDVELALGTDSGGSIRIPAAWCGIVGFKPTYDLVPTDGCFPLAPSYDHVGPMASTVPGCVELLQALAPEYEPTEIGSLAELKTAVAWIELADPLVGERVRALFPERADEYDERVRTKIERCLEVSDAEAATAQRLRDEYREQCAELLEGYDLLVTPTTAFVAPPSAVDEREIRRDGIRFTYPFDALGWPALALPCGLAEDGLPASVQLAAPQGADGRVLAAGSILVSLV